MASPHGFDPMQEQGDEDGFDPLDILRRLRQNPPFSESRDIGNEKMHTHSSGWSRNMEVGSTSASGSSTPTSVPVLPLSELSSLMIPRSDVVPGSFRFETARSSDNHLSSHGNQDLLTSSRGDFLNSETRRSSSLLHIKPLPRPQLSVYAEYGNDKESKSQKRISPRRISSQESSLHHDSFPLSEPIPRGDSLIRSSPLSNRGTMENSGLNRSKESHSDSLAESSLLPESYISRNQNGERHPITAMSPSTANPSSHLSRLVSSRLGDGQVDTRSHSSGIHDQTREQSPRSPSVGLSPTIAPSRRGSRDSLSVLISSSTPSSVDHSQDIIENALNSQTSSIQDLRNVVISLKRVIEKRNSEISNLNLRLEDGDRIRETQQKEIRLAEERLQLVTINAAELRSSYERLVEEMNQRTVKLAEVLDQRDELLQNLNSTQENHRMETEKVEELISNAESVMRSLREQVNESKNDNLQLRTQLEMERSRCQDLENELKHFMLQSKSKDLDSHSRQSETSSQDRIDRETTDFESMTSLEQWLLENSGTDGRRPSRVHTVEQLGKHGKIVTLMDPNRVSSRTESRSGSTTPRLRVGDKPISASHSASMRSVLTSSKTTKSRVDHPVQSSPPGIRIRLQDLEDGSKLPSAGSARGPSLSSSSGKPRWK